MSCLSLLLSSILLLYVCFSPQCHFSLLMRELRAELSIGMLGILPKWDPAENNDGAHTQYFSFCFPGQPLVFWSKSRYGVYVKGSIVISNTRNPQSFLFLKAFELPISTIWLHCHACANTINAHPNKGVHGFRNENHSILGKQTTPKYSKTM